MTTYNLIKASTLKTRLTKLSSDSIDNTLSLAYYTMINGNVTPLADCVQSIATLLHPVYRQYVCASWNKKKEAWEYNKGKATKLLKVLGLTYNDCTFEQFVEATEKNQATLAAKQADKAAQEAALSPAELENQEKERVLKYLVRTNLNATQLKDLVLQVERERTSVEAKKAGLKTAA